MKYNVKKWAKFIWKEIFLRYLFCYMVSFLTMGIVIFFKIREPWGSWLVSLSAAMFSFPVVFVVFNLYSEALDKKTKNAISQKLNMEVRNIFTRYLYFLKYFYYTIEEVIPSGEDILNESLSYSEEKIFSLVSDNVYSGVFLFSEFDAFDEYTYELFNDPIVAKYISRDEIVTLFEFIGLFKELRKLFKMIAQDDFIMCGKYTNIDIQKSEFVTNSEGKTFYDCKWIMGNNKYSVFYSATYPIFEEDRLLLKIKLSGNKAKEVSKVIYKSYQCINKWLNMHGEKSIMPDNSIVVNGRLYADYDLTINQFMKNNFSIANKF